MNSLIQSDMVTASMQTLQVAQADDAGSNRWMIYGLFLLAGLFVGGAYSAFKADNKVLAVGAGVIAVVAAAGGIFWLMGEMT